MIQDIDPHRLDIDYKVKDPGPDDYVVAIRGSQILWGTVNGLNTLPRRRDLQVSDQDANARLVYLLSVDGIGLHYYTDTLAEPEGFTYQDTFFLRGFQPSWLAFAAITASHLASWYSKNRFCGCCGGVMAPKADERALECPSCASVLYPTIAPAIIVGVIDGERLLMTRYANRPYRRLALVAGFMEVGETLEGTVHREVMEEAGVRVKNIRYYKSQPWGFSGSILVGFFADLDGAPDLTIDAKELEEAMWVDRKDVPADSGIISLTGDMTEAFRTGAI